MKKETDNNCADCGISWNCCTNLSRLRLSKDEFEKNFLRNRETLSIRQYHGIYEVSGRWNKCPNCEDNKCTVYKTRPIECRLYPFTIGDIGRIGRTVILTYHNRTCCPQKEILLAPREEVLRKLNSFAAEAFGPEARVIIFRDVFPLRVARFLIRTVHRIFRMVSDAVQGYVP